MARAEYTKARAAWTEAAGNEAVVYVRRQEDDDLPDGYIFEDSIGQVPDVSLMLKRVGGAQRFSINLTRMTAPELKSMQEVINLAFEKAIPAAVEIDEQARLAQEDGDDANPRLYRQVPVIHRRERGE